MFFVGATARLAPSGAVVSTSHYHLTIFGSVRRVWSRAGDSKGIKFDYLRRVRAAGGFPNYERAHREALTRTLSPKFALPPELVRIVVEFYLHAGFYPFTEVPATAPTATA